jgi:DNA replication protein DnaC
MKGLGTTLQDLRMGQTIMPDEAQCPVCGYFDVAHPDVKRLLTHRDPSGGLLYRAQCRCLALEERTRRDYELRKMQANLPHPKDPKTFVNFNMTEQLKAAVVASREFANSEGPPLLFLVGSTGAGKSHLMEAIGRHILETSAWTVRYEASSSLLMRLRETVSDYSEDDMAEVLAWYQRRRFFLLDDLGAEKRSDFTVERLTELIDERMRMGWRTAISTNLGREELADRCGERLASRLFQTRADLKEVRRVTIAATDYRGGKAGQNAR